MGLDDDDGDEDENNDERRQVIIIAVATTYHPNFCRSVQWHIFWNFRLGLWGPVLFRDGFRCKRRKANVQSPERCGEFYCSISSQRFILCSSECAGLATTYSSAHDPREDQSVQAIP